MKVKTTVRLVVSLCALTTAAGLGLSAGASASATKVAKGTPVVFGITVTEAVPAPSFVEGLQSAEATAKYINEKLGGIDGHPIKIDSCISDASSASSITCAHELVADHPLAILGGSDLNDANTIGIYKAAKLDYFGGMNFNPPEATASNSVIFNDTAESGNDDLGVYSVTKLKAANVGVLYMADPQGNLSTDEEVLPAIEASGGTDETQGVPPGAASATPQVEALLADNPNAVVLESPGQCVQFLNTLQSLGYSGPLLSIDTCSTSQVVAATGTASNGMLWFQPFQIPNVANPSADAKVANTILNKYGSSGAIVDDSPSLVEISSLMDLYYAFHTTPIKTLTSAYMLHYFKTGKNLRNFMAAPMTCNGSAVPALKSICNAKQYLYQMENGKAVLKVSNYDAGAKLTIN
jgi:branched-chain amino acid transport system substrate-binding protein